MARSEITAASGAFNAATAVTLDAIDLTNDHVLDLSGVADEKLAILIQNSSTINGLVTFVAGDFSEKGIGNLAVVLPASAHIVVYLESARFKNSAEELEIDLSSTGATTGTIAALVAP